MESSKLFGKGWHGYRVSCVKIPIFGRHIRKVVYIQSITHPSATPQACKDSGK